MTEGLETQGFAEPTGDISGIDADAVLSGVENGAGNLPADPASPAPTTQTPVTQQTSEIEFTWNGKPIKAPIDRVTQWASQGYDYSQKMAAFKQEQAQFSAQQKAAQELDGKWKPVEEYYAKNPQHFQRLMQEFQAGQIGADPNNPVMQYVRALEDKLGKVSEFTETMQAERHQQKLQAEDQRLDGEIQSIREQFKDLDWASVDASGKTLEHRVLEHAQASGIGNFRAAFRDMFHDDLVKKAEERGKEALVKERKTATKMGLLGQSRTPKTGLSAAEDIKNKSYDQLWQEGLAELAGAG